MTTPPQLLPWKRPRGTLAWCLVILALSGAGPLAAQEREVEEVEVPLPAPALTVPAAHPARAALLVGAGRPDRVLVAHAAAADLERRLAVTALASLVARGAGPGGSLGNALTLTAAGRLLPPLPAGDFVPPSRPATPPPTAAPPLDARLLAAVRDRKPLPTQWDRDLDERFAYNYVLYQASLVPPAAFARSVRDDLTYAHVFLEPRKYRGEVVRVRGSLRRLSRFDAPANLRAAGVPEVYEGWVFDADRPRNPWCVVFTELPRGLRPAERMDVQVTMDGYFFKRFRYKAGDSFKANEFRDAPLVMGRTLIVAPSAEGASAASSGLDWWLIALPVGVLGVLVLGAASVGSVWLRRSDGRVRARLRAIAPNPFDRPAGEAPAAAAGGEGQPGETGFRPAPPAAE